MGIGAGIFLVAVGAILTFAVNWTASGFNIHTVGIILMIAGVAGIILDIIIGVPMIVTNIALSVRRLHDSNHTGWWWWIGFVPLVGWIIAIVFYLLPSTPGPNRYSGAR